MSLSRSTQASASVSALAARSTQASAPVSALAVRRKKARAMTIPDTDEDDVFYESPPPSPVKKKRKTSPRHTRSDEDEADKDFVSLSSSSSSSSDVDSDSRVSSVRPVKRGRPHGTKNTKLKSISTSALPHTTRSAIIKDADVAKDELKELMRNQPAVQLSHIHPRNKDRSRKQATDVIGRVYNAHRMRLLSLSQLGFLKQKLDEIGCTVMPDGCWVANAGKKNRATFADPDAAKRPRGIMLDKRYKGVFAKQTFELAQIQMFASGVYPRSSEDEISHLCHNNFCLNPLHLLWELHPENVDRDRCRHTRDIQCPCCAHVFTICNHNPKCVSCTC